MAKHLTHPASCKEEQRRCTYCLNSKALSEFNREHIWPDGLGGNALPKPWITQNVCSRCNELSGRFVDGEFIKSWFIAHERSNAAREYMDIKRPEANWLPLSYIGLLPHSDLGENEVADVWLGPCGDHIVHIRPKQEPSWDTYVGGKPTRKRLEWGSAFLQLCSEEPFWIWAAVNSFHRHFKLANRYVLNMNKPQGFSPPFSDLDPNNADQVRRASIARFLQNKAQVGEQVRTKTIHNMDFGKRFLSKLALGIGREFLGEAFLDTPYADTLRRALWERDFVKRAQLPVLGVGYLGEASSAPEMSFLQWPGAWVIWVNALGSKLSVSVISPGGHAMIVQVSDDASLVRDWTASSPQGAVYIVVAAIECAVGPISGDRFLAHQLGNIAVPELVVLGNRRTHAAALPRCR